MLGGLSFFKQILTFYLAIFDGVCKYHSKDIVVLSLNLKEIFDCPLKLSTS